ncbi:MAG: UbiA prenyltransferase family protein [Thermoplasmatales archaeon]|nr:MAG: UbiA prenyltransferase family protein [Thermoplasmatales archaeon]
MNNYVKLIRPYGILFLGLTPVFGAICNGESRFFNLSIIFIIGILAHIFTFVQNDYYDMEIDKKSKYVLNRPLASGEISKNNVFLIFLFSFLLSTVLAVLFFRIAAFFVLLLSFFLMTLYNKYSKKLAGMEYVLSTGVFTYGIFGALTVSNNISTLAVIISLVGFMQWLFSVGISANLKDVEYDSRIGIKTTPTIFGVKSTNNKLEKPLSFLSYAYGIKTAHIMIASLPFFLGYTSIVVFNFPIPLMLFIILSIVLIYTTFGILSTSLTKRETMLRYEGVHEGFALLLIPIVLMSYLIKNFYMLPTLIVIVLIIAWPLFFLRLLFGKKMIPLE